MQDISLMMRCNIPSDKKAQGGQTSYSTVRTNPNAMTTIRRLLISPNQPRLPIPIHAPLLIDSWWHLPPSPSPAIAAHRICHGALPRVPRLTRHYACRHLCVGFVGWRFAQNFDDGVTVVVEQWDCCTVGLNVHALAEGCEGWVGETAFFYLDDKGETGWW
jgi:hypothetical protein